MDFFPTFFRFLTGVLLAFPISTMGSPQRIIMDADTGNEMDDLYAIVQALMSDEIEVCAVNSAHFNNPQLLTDEYWHIYPTKGIQTVKISRALKGTSPSVSSCGFQYRSHWPADCNQHAG